MNKFLGILLIIFSTFAFLKADAAVLSDSQAKAEIAKHVIKKYSQYTDAQLEVEVIALPFKTLEIPNGKLSFVIESNSNKFMPRELDRVLLFVDNKFIRAFTAPVMVKAYQEVLVASCNIPREKPINRSVVEVQRREVSNNIENLLKPSSIDNDMLAKKYFVKGEVIDKRFVKLKPDILRNANVTVMFNTNNLTISTEATALSDGIKGDNICIMNKNYNKIYKGTVIGENKVLVKI